MVAKRTRYSFVTVHFWGWGGVPRRLACCSSSSFICCSRSISMMRGTTRIRNVVPAIHAAFPVLFRSFLVTSTASLAACLPRDTMGEPLSFEIMLPLESLFAARLSGRETPPLRGCDAIEEIVTKVLRSWTARRDRGEGFNFWERFWSSPKQWNFNLYFQAELTSNQTKNFYPHLIFYYNF